MLRILVATSVLFLVAIPAASAQQDGEKLTSRAMCYACHHATDASIGPPWTAIAARYAGRKDLIASALVSKILRGGGGNWGLVPMVPNQRVTASDASTMVDWILAQTPGQSPAQTGADNKSQ